MGVRPLTPLRVTQAVPVADPKTRVRHRWGSTLQDYEREIAAWFNRADEGGGEVAVRCECFKSFGHVW